VIVPGDRVVMARCDSCWRYGNPREFVEVRAGGRKNAYSGTCSACAEEKGCAKLGCSHTLCYCWPRFAL
jgi:hypothetical protein